MKLLFATITAVAITSPRINAADAVRTTTDSNPVAGMAPPSGDPVVARGKGFEIRRSQMDQVLATAKANNPQEELPADAEVHVINQLIEMQLVLQQATDEEKAEGKRRRTRGSPRFRKL